nr:RNA-directed DNA polymerase, eukaryota, reverse transcriptase zinc-binding domain protein [Tanacetum cinerariifolium]
LKINLQKSHVLGVGVPCEDVRHGASLIGCDVMRTPFKYLGVTVGDFMSRNSTWVLSGKGFDFVSHVKKRVGNGQNTKFWLDTWILDSPLSVRFPRLFALDSDKQV